VPAATLLFHQVSVAGRVPVWFCFDEHTEDGVASWMREHGWIDEPVQRAFLDLVEPGARVVDLGCHLGTFSLPAAGAGAEVIAVDGSPNHAALLRRAAERNGFDRLHVEHGAVADSDGAVAFVERTIHSHVVIGEDDGADAVLVPTVTVDGLLARHGWDAPDLIKMDIEGSEPAALRGMREMFARGARPAFVFEGNSGMLAGYGESICSLRAMFIDLGYELQVVDHLRPGTLVAMPHGDGVQPEMVMDYVALSGPADGLGGWLTEPAFDVDQIVTRVIDSAASPAPGYRRHAADLLTHGPDWLRNNALAVAATAALARDESDVVRDLGRQGRATSLAAGYAATPEPPPADGLGDLLVLARGLHARSAPRGLERAGGLGVPAEPKADLGDVWLHMRRGESLGVVADDRRASSALLMALAGRTAPAAGTLAVHGRVVLLSGLGMAMEGRLTVEENIALFAGFLGAHVPTTSRRATEIADGAGVAPDLTRPLWDAGPETAVRIALAVALEFSAPDLMLLDVLPAFGDSFGEWAAGQISRLRGYGGGVVQVVADPTQLLFSPSRLAWIADGRLRACGHTGSVAGWWQHDRLGLVRGAS
jgi:FkbM family methyltransferase